MKNKKNILFGLIILLAGISNFALQVQQKKSTPNSVKTKDLSISQAPKGIVRTIKQDRKDNIWITSWEGIFKYGGKSFTNITSKVSSARFFSVLEDRKGNFWFASIGSGVYYYDGKSFRNFTTKDGLASDRVGAIYEDRTGIIWFGTERGVSRYNGKSLHSFKIKETPPAILAASGSQQSPPEANWIHNDINAIIEDTTGKFWFGTRGYATVYDGKTFTTILNKNGKPFTNVRSIIKDKKGTMWLGGADGLWRYNGKTFTNLTKKFVGYIYEDKNGNIWTSSESGNAQGWVLSRYDGKTLSNKKPKVTEIASKPMIFGILEDRKGTIWFGDLDGVNRYDGKTITSFKSKI